MPIFPANILNLNSFKLGLPVNSSPGVPVEIHMPQLATYTSPFFRRLGSAVQFTAPVSGDIQKGSKYPRSELREKNLDGTLASWSPSSGRHTMTIMQQIMTLPEKKPEVVAGQIHDGPGYVLLVWVRGNGDGTARVIARVNTGVTPTDVELLPRYTLGTVLTVQIVAELGTITCSVNELGPALDIPWPKDRDGCYFKAGCYTQSNLTIPGENPLSEGKVLIRSLAITHEP